MKYRRFGNLDFEVSVLGFGGAAVSGEGGGYGFGQMANTDAINLLHRAYDVGLNLFDTAPIYGFGLSEERIGRAFGDRRDKVFLVSKSGITWDFQNRSHIDNSRQVTQDMLHQSLKRMQTDYLDLYLIHWPDPKVDIREPMEVLAKAKEEGKIRAIGLCNSFPGDIEKAFEIERVDVLQNEFNLFKNYPRDTLFTIIKEQQMGFMSWGTLEKGILTGRVTRDRTYDLTDVRSHAPWWTQADHEPKFRAMEKMLPYLKEQGYSGLEMALGYVLQYSEVSTALCGVKNPTQLESALEALLHLPNQDLLAEIYEIAKESQAISN